MKKNKTKIQKINLKNSLSPNAYFLACLSGVLLFLSFPKYGNGYIAWLAFIPLFWALREATTIRQGLLLGIISGLVSQIGLIYWISYSIVNYGYLPIYLGIILMMLVALYLSIYTAIFAGGLVIFREKIVLYFIAPVLWVCLEYLKSYILTGFPWENLGYSQWQNFYLIQFSDVAGVYGISFLIILFNAVLFKVVTKKSKQTFIMAAVVVLILSTVIIYGVKRIKQVDNALQNARTMDVLLVQGNIDQSIKWYESYQKETIKIYESLSLQRAPIKDGLIVWPETAVPFNYQDISDFQRQVRNISLTTHNWFLFGSTSYVSHKLDTDYFNSAYLLSPAGEINGKYDKVHLVPYGEYVPLRNVFPFIKKLTAGMGDFSVGTGYHPLQLNDRKVGVLICYEAILPNAARMYKKEGAELLVNITNDAWFGATSAPFQHFSMAIFRAIETRLYLVRAANTGISGIVDPRGGIIAQTDIFERTALKGNIKFINLRTIYAQYGDILVYICFAIMIICILLVIIRRITDAGRKYSGNS